MQMKRKILRTVCIMLYVVTFVCMTASAGSSGWITKSYGDFSLSCYISCTSSKGVSKTNGAMTDNKNRAAITIYNSDGVSLGNSTVIADVPDIAEASATKSGKVYKAVSCHSLVRVLDGTNVLPLYQQVQMSETKD
jgi:hypothetical protein